MPIGIYVFGIIKKQFLLTNLILTTEKATSPEHPPPNVGVPQPKLQKRKCTYVLPKVKGSGSYKPFPLFFIIFSVFFE